MDRFLEDKATEIKTIQFEHAAELSKQRDQAMETLET